MDDLHMMVPRRQRCEAWRCGELWRSRGVAVHEPRSVTGIRLLAQFCLPCCHRDKSPFAGATVLTRVLFINNRLLSCRYFSNPSIIGFPNIWIVTPLRASCGPHLCDLDIPFFC